MIIPFNAPQSRTVNQSTPANLNPIHWHQSLGLARQVCARVFRDGGKPTDALVAFGLPARADIGWDKAVELVAMAMAHGAPGRKAA
jgi:hypothetical protein